MKKIKIKIGKIGVIPFEFNWNKITKLNSKVIEILDDVDEFHFSNNSDSNSWEYSDELLNSELPDKYEGDFFICITYVPLENNYYTRKLENNRVVISYFEMYHILEDNNIPLENLLLRVIYGYTILYLRNNQIPEQTLESNFTHDDTRGCLFDMNGNKSDVVFSLDIPKICSDCWQNIINDKVPENQIEIINAEIEKIRKKRFDSILMFIRKKPLISIVISAVFALFLNIFANYIFKLLTVE